MIRFIKVSEAKRHGLPVSSATLYKWRHLGKYPELFRKLGGMLLVNLEEFERLIVEGGGKDRRNRKVRTQENAEGA